MRSHESPLAVVVSTNHDKPTKFCHAAAIEAKQLLEQAGFEVKCFYGPDAVAENLYVYLTGLKNSAKYVCIGYFVAHGSNSHLLGYDKLPLLDHRTGELMASSILVMNACLKDGLLPTAATSPHKPHAEACIGYSPSLRTIPNFDKNSMTRLNQLLNACGFDGETSKNYRRCLVAPLDSLLRGENVEQAIAFTKDTWDALLGPLFCHNVKSLRFWGNGSSSLSFLNPN